MTATTEADATAQASAAIIDPTVGFRRRATAVALPLAFVLQTACNSIYAIATLSGMGDTGDGDQTLAFYARFFTEMQWATTFALLGALLLVPGMVAAVRVLRPAKPRLTLWAAVLMVAGYVSYFGIVMTNFLTAALGQAYPHAGEVVEAAQGAGAAFVWFGLFVIGNLVGTLLLGLAAILSRAVPWWAGALIIAWPVSHVIGLSVGSEFFEVGGGVLEVIGLVVVAVTAWRMPDAEWARRG